MKRPHDPFVDFAIEQFSPLGEITAKRMFGGYCLYCDGTVFALIANGAVYLKADDQNRPDFQAAGIAPFRPFEDQDVVMQYYAAPPEIYENPDDLRRWVLPAIAAGRRTKPKSRKR
jgi:DNA transformation protein and related proteins